MGRREGRGGSHQTQGDHGEEKMKRRKETLKTLEDHERGGLVSRSHLHRFRAPRGVHSRNCMRTVTLACHTTYRLQSRPLRQPQ